MAARYRLRKAVWGSACARLQRFSWSGYSLFAAKEQASLWEGAMQKPKARKIAGELTEADLAKVIGGVAVLSPVNKRRRPIPICCDSTA